MLMGDLMSTTTARVNKPHLHGTGQLKTYLKRISTRDFTISAKW